jgi:integrase
MARRGRGEGSVYQRKDGSWVAQLNGTYRYARDEETAKQKLYKLLAGAEEAKPENITVGKHFDDYLKHVQTNLKPRTVKRYREAIDAHLKPAFGKQKLHTLDAQKIEAMYIKKLEQGISPASIHVLHAVLSASMKRAVRLKLLQTNPCKHVDKPKIERDSEDGAVKVFDRSEVQRILSAAKSDPLEALYVLIFNTGLRVGEALALKRSDADLQAGTLRISRTVYNGVVGTPKSKRSRRTITLPKIPHDALAKHINQGMYVESDYLFASQAGTPMWYWAFITRKYKPLLQRAGMSYKNIHTARHTVASTLLARGLPITSVARYMGHDEQTLLSTYSHLMPDQMDTVAAAMDSALGDSF